jgi:zinc metalloprotease ZmpB
MLSAAILLALAAGVSAAPPPQPSGGALASAARAEGGVVRDALSLDVTVGGGRDAADSFIRTNATLFLGEAEDGSELRLVEEKQSLSGVHYRYRQFAGGVEIGGSDLTLHVLPEGKLAAIHNRAFTGRVTARRESPAIDPAAIVASLHRGEIELVERAAAIDGGRLRHAWRVVRASGPIERWESLVDAETGEIFRDWPMFYNAVRARVFEANPVTVLNDPTLSDQNDSAAAVPAEAYSEVELLGLGSSGPLAGPHVVVTDFDLPFTTRAEISEPLLFDRSDQRFEEVMAYYHLDLSQRYLQSLGFTGERQTIRRAVPVDAHAASGADASYYSWIVPGEGRLHFGDGGVDDAEDPDILLHEYSHAIQDAVAPGMFNGTPGSEARALGEAIADYWAFSAGWEASLASGRDPYCIGDWDARCGVASSGCIYPPGADCLRRVDGTKTMSDYISSDQRGTEHLNSAIWSSALREIFVRFATLYGSDGGRRIADTIVTESLFGMPPQPTFRTAAVRMLGVDRALYGGRHGAAICSAMSVRGIVSSGDCSLAPRGEHVLMQGGEQGVAIPDGSASGIVLTRFVADARIIDDLRVSVSIEHPRRGDLRIVLVAPDGRSATLQAQSADESPDLRVTYGADADPRDSLETFRGISAHGEWKLHVVDNAPRDAGRLERWGLHFRFEGEVPVGSRGFAGGDSLTVPVATHGAGAMGTDFRTDLTIFNRSLRSASVSIFFTPVGTSGIEQFSVVRVEIEPGQTVSLDDVVARTFRATGPGSLELRGDVGRVDVTSRTYNAREGRTWGQSIPSFRVEEGIRTGGTAILPQLMRNVRYRTNVGFAEMTGQGGEAEITVFDGGGSVVETRRYAVAPFGHVQVPLLETSGAEGDALRAEVAVVSGGAVLLPYASVVDNVSGDAVFVSPRHAADDALVVPVVVRSPGALGTEWRSDVWVTNRGGAREVELTFRDASGGVAGRMPLAIGAGESRRIEDVVSLLGAAGAGSLSIGGARDLVVSSRTYTGAAATYGQSIAAVAAGAGMVAGGTPRSAAGIENNARFRTNVGASELSGAAAVVRFSLFDSAGTKVSVRDAYLPARGHVQLSLSDASEVTSGRVTAEVIGGEGSVVLYASVVDNSTGDPVYLPLR